jgi:Flp pilus assembly protein TadG
VLARARDDQGQALVEFALVLPLLLAGVVGILSFGRAMNYNEQATHLASEAARYATVDQVPANASGQTLGQWLRSQVDAPELQKGSKSVTSPQVCVSYPAGTTTVGSPVAISVSFTFNWLPILHLGVTSSTITQTATMRIEVPPTSSFFAAGCS